jgi:hypothetical protein
MIHGARKLNAQLARHEGEVALTAAGYQEQNRPYYGLTPLLSGPEQSLFFTCFRRPGVPPTNNQAEQSLRAVVIMRKVIQSTRSDKGLENHSVLRSLFETAKRQGKKPHSFFLELLTKNTAEAQAALYRKPLIKRERLEVLRC